VELDRSQLQDGFQTTVAAREHELEQLRKTLKATALELVSARTRSEALQANMPELQRQLEESRLETRRQFHRTPVALGRCTRDGALTHFNRAFADLVGYRNPSELRGADFAKTVFESPDDLSWLTERCLSTHARESVETAWKRRNGERLVVRLSALESAPDIIEIAAEDITDLRALQERLGQAHRMEAVGRLASEIAVTCGNLLGDVHQDAQQWLTTLSDDAVPRQRGERLLDQVMRAANLLQKLAVYGHEQTNAPEKVDLNRVLRDLKPVLKQVAGDEVALELPKISSPLHVDVSAERVERLLVNLANYGRERMPSGGRLKFELATVVVNQRFIAQYPSVRPGAHVLITVTEVRRFSRAAEGSLQLGTTSDAGRVTSEKPGVDLEALQELIRECGGHLWMTVEPAGNMVVKIHLPLRGGDDEAGARTPDTRSRLGRAAARWFGR
jgi:PAS domain S-box-containing protein